MDIQSLLKKLNCSNTESTASRFLNDYDFYVSSLKELFTDENWSVLGQQIESKQQRKAFETAHLLKGVVANCGLTILYDKLFILVEILRKDDEPNYENLISIYNDIIKTKDEIKMIF